MRFITMDDEAADLLEAAAEMGHAALQARAKRRDPDEIISRSYEMSRIKTSDVIRQLREPPLGAWGVLPEHDQHQVLKLFKIFLDLETLNERNELWKIIRTFVLRRAPCDPSEHEATREASVGLQASMVENDAEAREDSGDSVRKVLKVKRRSNASP